MWMMSKNILNKLMASMTYETSSFAMGRSCHIS